MQKYNVIRLVKIINPITQCMKVGTPKLLTEASAKASSSLEKKKS